MDYHTLSLAPMMDCTDRHFRYLTRLLAPKSLLYTEMITTGAIIHGNRSIILDFHANEHPIAVQFGGSNSQELAIAAKICEEWGYDEINLNVGCPSQRVQSGKIGACLMLEPKLVAECISAMQAVASIPVTVKCRIGVDKSDSLEDLQHFIETVMQTGCNTFIIHARKAWLNGLSPKENRTIPPLKYEAVYQIKKQFPKLKIIINGGIENYAQIQDHLKMVDGVMIGRLAYNNLYAYAELERVLFQSYMDLPTRETVLKQYADYVSKQLLKGVPLKLMTRHLISLFYALPGARQIRGLLSGGDENRIREFLFGRKYRDLVGIPA
ncbi:MAG: tRNA dihydrouridine(20/20a) synthase DusA [Gammaproteobacteria bacterium]